MDKKKNDDVDYAAAYRQFMNFSHGLSLKQFCEDKGFDYGKLQQALIRIAQLEDELKAQASRPDWTAREKELNDRHSRELYDQKMFFKEMMDEQKESHRIEMENLRKALREENDRTIQHIEGVLARWWQRRNWHKNSERKDILNGRNPKLKADNLRISTI